MRPIGFLVFFVFGLFRYSRKSQSRRGFVVQFLKRLVPNAWLTPSADKRPVFFIGFHKTGTSYYSNLFNQLGFKVMHDSHWRTGSIAVIEDYDMFFDGCLHNFEEMHRQYPNAKFVLNTRPLRSWLISRMAWSDCGNQWSNLEKRLLNPIARWIWGNDSYYDLERVVFWVKERRAYHHRAVNFFLNYPDNFLILNLEDPEKLGKLGRFLSIDVWSEQDKDKRNSNEPEKQQHHFVLADQVLTQCSVEDPNEIV